MVYETICNELNNGLSDTNSHAIIPGEKNSRKNEEMEPKQKQYPVVDVTGDRSKV